MSTHSDNMQEQDRPLLGIGACLNGQAVRYNGDSKSANASVKRLRDFFAVQAFCPEMGIGLGVPRPPIHLVGEPNSVRVLDVATHSNDYSAPLAEYAEHVVDKAPQLCGYILVKGSPSCGYDRVKRYSEAGHQLAADQRGYFAAALERLDPLLPLEDDGRLNDPGLCESFVTRALTYHAWKQLHRGGLSAHAVVNFYSQYKYQLMAHDQAAYKRVGRMLADAGKRDIDALAAEFIAELMAGLKQRATVRSHANVLFHLAGYLKKRLAGQERQRLAALIEQYRQGEVPLIVPITLLKHHFANHPNAYIDKQIFLAPYPDALGMRNHL